MDIEVQDLGLGTALSAVLAAYGDVSGTRIVDIGSGEGKLALGLAERGAEVTGIDPLGPATSWTAAGRGRFRLLREYAETMPFADGEIDLAVVVYALHHVPADAQPIVLREIARVLKPEGMLFVAEPLAEGAQFSVTRLFHDETAVRAEAARILEEQAVLFAGPRRRMSYAERRIYSGFEQYVARTALNMRFNGYTEQQIRAEPVQRRFEAVFAETGGMFDQPVRVDLLTR
jgi:ubiquinone/menaquinone biosynthesis C-methylase UbiE